MLFDWNFWIDYHELFRSTNLRGKLLKFYIFTGIPLMLDYILGESTVSLSQFKRDKHSFSLDNASFHINFYLNRFINECDIKGENRISGEAVWNRPISYYLRSSSKKCLSKKAHSFGKIINIFVLHLWNCFISWSNILVLSF